MKGHVLIAAALLLIACRSSTDPSGPRVVRVAEATPFSETADSVQHSLTIQDSVAGGARVGVVVVQRMRNTGGAAVRIDSAGCLSDLQLFDAAVPSRRVFSLYSVAPCPAVIIGNLIAPGATVELQQLLHNTVVEDRVPAGQYLLSAYAIGVDRRVVLGRVAVE